MPENLVLPSHIGSKQVSLKVSEQHIHTHIHRRASLHTKDLFSACVEGSGLGRPFDVGTLRSEKTVCAALNSIPHNSSFFTSPATGSGLRSISSKQV